MKIALVSGICVFNDALSASVRDDYLAISSAGVGELKLYTYRCDFQSINHKIVSDLSSMIFDRFYLDADIIIFHFGVYYELFNAIILGNGHARQIVRYHNVTPKQWLPKHHWPTIKRSLEQIANFDCATEIWPVSEYNSDELRSLQFLRDKTIQTIPLIASYGGRKKSFRDKDFSEFRMLYVGRYVASKGIADFVKAIELVHQSFRHKFNVTLIGNTSFSDNSYCVELEKQIDKSGFCESVRFMRNASDDLLKNELTAAHCLVIPSYHEGFCKPVIEALEHGCVPITYDSSNLKYVAKGCSALVQTGNIGELAKAIERFYRKSFDSEESRSISIGDGVTISIQDFEIMADRVLGEYEFSSVAGELVRNVIRLRAR